MLKNFHIGHFERREKSVFNLTERFLSRIHRGGLRNDILRDDQQIIKLESNVSVYLIIFT